MPNQGDRDDQGDNFLVESRDSLPRAGCWTGRWRSSTGRADGVAEDIRPRADRGRLDAAKRRPAEQAADYLAHKAPYLDYPTALAHGWPIATRGHRGRLPPPSEGQDGHHRSALGARWRRGCPEAPGTRQQRRFRHLLALPPLAGAATRPRHPLRRQRHPASGMTPCSGAAPRGECLLLPSVSGLPYQICGMKRYLTCVI